MRFSCISESSVSMFKVNYMALLGPTLPKVNAAIMSPTKPNYFHRTLITNLITQESNLSTRQITRGWILFMIIGVLK